MYPLNAALTEAGAVPAAALSCLFRRITGLYCPGCGGTRSFFAMLHGHLLRSFLYHPMICYAIVSAMCGILLYFTKKTASARIISTILLGAVIVLLLNYNVRNILLLLGIPTLS